MIQELKPCPFCGSEDVHVCNIHSPRTFVMCNNCGASIDEIDCDCDPIELWNTCVNSDLDQEEERYRWLRNQTKEN